MMDLQSIIRRAAANAAGTPGRFMQQREDERWAPANRAASLESRYRPGEIDPENRERLERSLEGARELREGPLISGIAARRAGEQALHAQAAATGRSPESRIATTAKGAGVGGQILSQYGQQMASEDVTRYGVGLRLAQAWQQLKNGTVLQDFIIKLKEALAAEGIALNESQANAMGTSMLAAQIGQMMPEDKEVGYTSGAVTPTPLKSGAGASQGAATRTPLKSGA